jgi:solute carrier family 66 (lysosomal lysine-arginine transporter), member 1
MRLLTDSAIWGGLLPSVIILSAYFIIADAALFFQIRYFRKHPHPKYERSRSRSRTSTESSPLLPRRLSFADREPATLRTKSVQYTLALTLVIAAGVLGWALSSENHARETPLPSRADELGPKILGYASAILYLSARIPQIYHNYRLKSTEGLSLLFFMFSTLGNISFTLSIVFGMTGEDYLLLNLPWIIGSTGTIIFDLIVPLL